MLSRSGTPDLAAVTAAVAGVVEPELHLSLGAAGMLRHVRPGRRGRVEVAVALTSGSYPLRDRLDELIRTAAGQVSGVSQVGVVYSVMSDLARQQLTRQVAAARVPADGAPLAPAIYAVASGKGGVGKSSVAANLAVALAAPGRRVGLIDADVWGYSVPQLFGTHREPIALDGVMVPVEAHGVRLMSIGFLIEEETPVVWRGPMLHKALSQFVTAVAWGELDVLLLDLPPGTGDVTLSLLELLPDAALLAVTTPAQAARTVASRVGRLATEAQMPIAGVVENMSELVCAGCGERTALFGQGGGAQLAGELGAALLGQVPLDIALREAGDRGVPVVVGAPESPSAVALRQIAAALRPVRRSLVGRPLNLSVVGAPPR